MSVALETRFCLACKTGRLRVLPESLDWFCGDGCIQRGRKMDGEVKKMAEAAYLRRKAKLGSRTVVARKKQHDPRRTDLETYWARKKMDEVEGAG